MDVQPSRSKTPRRERRGTSAERDLTDMREAHWRVLATAAAPEEKMERLSQPVTWGWPDAHAHSWSCDHQRRRSWDKVGGAIGFSQRRPLPPSLSTALPSGVQNPGRMERPNCLSWISTWSHCWCWDQRLTISSKSWLAAWGKMMEAGPPRTPSGRVQKMGDLGSTGARNAWLVARGSQDFWCGWPPGASPECMGLLQASPGDKWAAWHGLLPEGLPPTAWFKVCLPGHQGVTVGEDSGLCPGPPVLGGESQSAYSRPTMPFGREHIKVKGANEMLHFLPWQCCFWWHGPSRWIPDKPVGDNYSWECPASIHQFPIEKAAVKAAEEEASPIGRPQEGLSTSQTLTKEQTRREHSPNWFPGWREVLHPSRLGTTAGQVPLISWGSKWRPHSKSSGERMVWCWRAEEELQTQNARSEPTLPTGTLKTAWQMTPPQAFWGVMVCLWRDLLLVDAYEAPLDTLQLAALVEPTVVMMSASCIMKDEATGIIYMDTITTSVGWVALSGPSQGTQATGPIINNITNLP